MAKPIASTETSYFQLMPVLSNVRSSKLSYRDFVAHRNAFSSSINESIVLALAKHPAVAVRQAVATALGFGAFIGTVIFGAVGR